MPIVARLLVVAKCVGSDGADVVAGYIDGYKTQMDIAETVMPNHYEAGWYATATSEMFSIAMATARVLGLDAEETRTVFST